jgi:hypothetical protein
MPDVPWELLASRLSRYLQLSYVLAVTAGATLSFCAWVAALNGTPASRRHQIKLRVTDVTSHHNAWFVLVLLIAVVTGCYLVGSILRYFTNWVVSKIMIAWYTIIAITGLNVLFIGCGNGFSVLHNTRRVGITDV